MTNHQLSTKFRLKQVDQYMHNFAIASFWKLRFIITSPPLLSHKKKSWKTLEHALSNLNQILNYPPAWQHHWGGRESNPLPPRLMNRGRLPPTHYLHRFPRWPLPSSHSTPIVVKYLGIMKPEGSLPPRKIDHETRPNLKHPSPSLGGFAWFIISMRSKY